MIIEDRLTFDDGLSPQPVPQPQPIPTPTPQPRTITLPSLSTILPHVVMIAALAFGGWQWWANREKKPTPGPTPTVDAVTLGKNFAPKLSASLADGFETAATMIAAGTSVTDADKSLKTKFAAARNEAFKTSVAPEFSKILPEGQEPKDQATRDAFAKIHRDFASGLRGAK